MWSVRLALVAATWLADAPARATVISVSRRYEVSETHGDITAIAVGDRYVVQFELDDTTVDTNSSTISGFFPGLVSSFGASAAADNTGSWTPSGTFDLGVEATFSTSSSAIDYVNFRVPGSGFPNGGENLVFVDFDLVWDGPSDFADSGSGQSFADVLGAPFDLPPAVFLGNGIAFELELDPGEQVDAVLVDVTLFVDGFESGGTSRWSAAVL
jgi:hypothetical protein